MLDHLALASSSLDFSFIQSNPFFPGFWEIPQFSLPAHEFGYELCPFCNFDPPADFGLSDVSHLYRLSHYSLVSFRGH